MLPGDYCKKDPCNFNTEVFVLKVGNPCPTLGQLLASRICTRSWSEKNSTKSPGQDFVDRVAQKLANSWSTPRQFPTPWEVAGVFVFLATVLWQHPIPAYSGAFLLTAVFGSFLLRVGASLLTIGAFLLTIATFCLQCSISTLTDCKQRRSP